MNRLSKKQRIEIALRGLSKLEEDMKNDDAELTLRNMESVVWKLREQRDEMTREIDEEIRNAEELFENARSKFIEQEEKAKEDYRQQVVQKVLNLKRGG